MLLERVVGRLLDVDFATTAREISRLSARLLIAQQRVFAVPTTYMNESGRAVRSVIEYYDKTLLVTSSEKIILLYDDLDIPLGQWKIQRGKGPKVHNGLNSVRDHLGTDAFTHVRIGVDGRAGMRTVSGSDYVLQQFLPTELSELERVMSILCDEVCALLSPPKKEVKKPTKINRSPAGFSSTQELLQRFALEDKGGYISQEFQDFGYRLAMELDDPAHKSLYMKMAKKESRALLERALSFVSDATTAKSKARLFMWKLRQLKNEQALVQQEKHQVTKQPS
jgi:PTH1 family peptidyl-tRNA hydrolase